MTDIEIYDMMLTAPMFGYIYPRKLQQNYVEKNNHETRQTRLQVQIQCLNQRNSRGSHQQIQLLLLIMLNCRCDVNIPIFDEKHLVIRTVEQAPYWA